MSRWQQSGNFENAKQLLIFLLMLFHDVSFIIERPDLSYHPSNKPLFPIEKYHQQLETIFKLASISGRGRRHVSRSRIES